MQHWELEGIGASGLQVSAADELMKLHHHGRLHNKAFALLQQGLLTQGT